MQSSSAARNEQEPPPMMPVPSFSAAESQEKGSGSALTPSALLHGSDKGAAPKMSDAELLQFIDKQRASLNPEKLLEVQTQQAYLQTALKHIVEEQKAGGVPNARELAEQLPKMRGGVVAPSFTPSSSSSSSSFTPSSSSSTLPSSSASSASTPLKALTNTATSSASSSDTLNNTIASAALNNMSTTTSSGSNSNNAASSLSDTAASMFGGGAMSEEDMSLRSASKAAASAPYSRDKDVPVLIGPCRYTLLTATGPSAKLTTKTSEWAIRIWGGVNSAAEAEEAKKRIRQENPYAINMDIFMVENGGGYGGALWPPNKNSMSNVQYENERLDKFMQEHQREVTKGHRVYEKRLQESRENSEKNRQQTRKQQKLEERRIAKLKSKEIRKRQNAAMQDPAHHLPILPAPKVVDAPPASSASSSSSSSSFSPATTTTTTTTSPVVGYLEKNPDGTFKLAEK